MGSIALQTSYSAAPGTAYEGQLHGQGPHDIVMTKNAEVSASIAFGRAVKLKSSPTTEKDVVLPTAGSDAIFGIHIKTDAVERTWTGADGTTFGEYDGTGFRPGSLLNTLRGGKIVVVCQSGCVVGDRLFVRAIAGTFTVIGGLESLADSTNTIDCTKQGQWLSPAAAGAFAVLDVDFTNKP